MVMGGHGKLKMYIMGAIVESEPKLTTAKSGRVAMTFRVMVSTATKSGKEWTTSVWVRYMATDAEQLYKSGIVKMGNRICCEGIPSAWGSEWKGKYYTNLGCATFDIEVLDMGDNTRGEDTYDPEDDAPPY